MSWTQEILHVSDVIALGEKHQVVVLGADEEKKLLKLGVRELEDSPWQSFEKTFTVGSEHEGVIKKKLKPGAIVELPYGLQVFVSNKELVKEDKSPMEVGQVLDFRIMEFVKHEHKVLISHTAVFKQPEEGKLEDHAFTPLKKSTLSDLASLNKLKEKLADASEKQEEEDKD